MGPKDFRSYNISVWRLNLQGGGVEYLVRRNTTIGELEAEFGPAADGHTRVGFHTEMLIANDIYTKRPDVRNGRTHISQIFTERFPCRECQVLLSAYPQFKSAAYYYYLSYTDKTWQKSRAGGDWGLFLRKQYG